MPRATSVPVYLEIGAKRVFACAVDWPGWARAAKTEDEALQRLAAYAERYVPVAKEAGLALPALIADAIKVTERVDGNATTDFGAPSALIKLDREAVNKRDATRTANLVAASWAALDRVVAAAPPELRKGPRGGGRDRDKIVDHVLDAEVSAYARKLGLKIPTPRIDDKPAIGAEREALLEVLRRPYDGSPPEGRNWPASYAARRIAWHALDHAWEIEDRSD